MFKSTLIMEDHTSVFACFKSITTFHINFIFLDIFYILFLQTSTLLEKMK